MFNEVLGSLTLGGYDKGLFTPNNVEFPFGPDQSFDLQVGLQSITASNGTNIELLPDPGYYFIDSTTPQIWLPLEACQAFEQAFGLVYDNATGLYLLNATQHAALLAQNSSITFIISPFISDTPSQQVSITLPYAAFDLEVSWGYTNVSAPTPYFPLRRAANKTQYVLGRTFLQEAYLTVDYHHQNFSVSQRSWSHPQTSELVSIFHNPPDSSSKFRPGIIAAIAIAGLVVLSLIFAIWFFLRRKRLQAKKRKEDDERAARNGTDQVENIIQDPFATLDGVINEIYTDKWEPPELHGKHFFNGAEVDGSHASEQRHELGKGMEGIEGRHELEAPHGNGELMGSGSGSTSSRKSVSEGVTETGLTSPAEPVTPECQRDGSERGLAGSETSISPQSPAPPSMRNDRHLVYGFFS